LVSSPCGRAKRTRWQKPDEHFRSQPAFNTWLELMLRRVSDTVNAPMLVLGEFDKGINEVVRSVSNSGHYPMQEIHLATRLGAAQSG
jgi:hypothetical protein